MKPSKVALVGQIRRSSGISMKIRMKPQTLENGQWCGWGMELDGLGAYSKITLQRMMMSKWKMLAMPRAKARIMHITPVLRGCVRCYRHTCVLRGGRARTIGRIYLCSYVLVGILVVRPSGRLTEVARLELLRERHDALLSSTWLCVCICCSCGLPNATLALAVSLSFRETLTLLTS